MRPLASYLVAPSLALVCAAPVAQELVDQGVEDLDPLAVSLRVELAEPFRDEIGFARLFEDPDRPGRLIRRDAGITASFPRSQYVRAGEAVVPVIPADTVFYIGEPAASFSAAPPAFTPRTRLNPRKLTIEPLARRVAESRTPALPEFATPVITRGRVVADEARRRVRLRELRHDLGPS